MGLGKRHQLHINRQMFDKKVKSEKVQSQRARLSGNVQATYSRCSFAVCFGSLKEAFTDDVLSFEIQNLNLKNQRFSVNVSKINFAMKH